LFFFQGCKKLIEVDGPYTSTNAANVYLNDATAAAVLTSIYTKISANNFSDVTFSSISLYSGLSADELTLLNLSNQNYLVYYRNMITSLNQGFWSEIYPLIFTTNSAIEGLTNSKSLSSSVKNQLIGEAKFMRAFCYFYLTNLYGDVPLSLSTDYSFNAVLPKASKDQVYQQMINDLKEARELLSSYYVNSDVVTITSERIRPNKWSAIALLARVYLYNKDYVNAEIQSDSVIRNSNMYHLENLENTFLKISEETIWQLQPVKLGENTNEAIFFILPSGGPNILLNPVYLSNSLIESFETGDGRKSKWIDSVMDGNTAYYYPYKYKISLLNSPVTEYKVVLRLSEQYLIRAESRVKNGNVLGAIEDINKIRVRAGLPEILSNMQLNILIAIKHQRRVELFTEWGDRWLELKRTDDIDSVMNMEAIKKGGHWEATDKLYPIILSELKANPFLVQNAGY